MTVVSKRRKHHGFTQGQQDRWREKIKVGHAIAALNLGIMGKIELSTARMKAIEIALRKSLPDLQSIDLTTGGEPIQFRWAKAEPVTIIDGAPSRELTETEAEIVSFEERRKAEDLPETGAQISAPEKTRDG